MRVDDERHAPVALPSGKTRYPLYRRLGGPQGRYRRVRKISPPLGFDPRSVQPVARRYTDYTCQLSLAYSQRHNLKDPYNKNSVCTVETVGGNIQVLWEEKTCRLGNTDLSMDYSASVFRIKQFSDLFLIFFALEINALCTFKTRLRSSATSWWVFKIPQNTREVAHIRTVHFHYARWAQWELQHVSWT